MLDISKIVRKSFPNDVINGMRRCLYTHVHLNFVTCHVTTFCNYFEKSLGYLAYS